MRLSKCSVIVITTATYTTKYWEFDFNPFIDVETGVRRLHYLHMVVSVNVLLSKLVLRQSNGTANEFLGCSVPALLR